LVGLGCVIVWLVVFWGVCVVVVVCGGDVLDVMVDEFDWMGVGVIGV